LLPTRADFDGSGQPYNIAIGPVTGDGPMWHELPDVVASVLKTGRVPRILRGVRLMATGKLPAAARWRSPLRAARRDVAATDTVNGCYDLGLVGQDTVGNSNTRHVTPAPTARVLGEESGFFATGVCDRGPQVPVQEDGSSDSHASGP
jgi:hypothetical protein